jgi:hypothetical protein
MEDSLAGFAGVESVKCKVESSGILPILSAVAFFRDAGFCMYVSDKGSEPDFMSYSLSGPQGFKYASHRELPPGRHTC